MKPEKPPQTSPPSHPPTLTREDLKILKQPFPKDRLGVKVQAISKERTRALLVLYLQHTDVQDRLEQVDPTWSTEILTEEHTPGSVHVRMRLTLKGVSRENVGEGTDPKSAYSDALKRCAMLFGVGRYLYDMPTVWVDYNESRDRSRHWSAEDYEKFSGLETLTAKPPEGLEARMADNQQASKTSVGPTEEAEVPGLKTVALAPESKKSLRSREELNRLLMNLYRPFLVRYPETRFAELLHARYGVSETRLMSLEQVEDLVHYMEDRLKAVA